MLLGEMSGAREPEGDDQPARRLPAVTEDKRERADPNKAGRGRVIMVVHGTGSSASGRVGLGGDVMVMASDVDAMPKSLKRRSAVWSAVTFVVVGAVIMPSAASRWELAVSGVGGLVMAIGLHEAAHALAWVFSGARPAGSTWRERRDRGRGCTGHGTAGDLDLDGAGLVRDPGADCRRCCR